MIASAVWFHLERGVDISDIVRYFHPEFEFPDTLYLFHPKDAIDEKVRRAIRMTVVPCAGDPSLGQQDYPRVSLQKACGAFFDKDDPRKQGHVYFKDRRYQMRPPVPDIPDTDVPETPTTRPHTSPTSYTRPFLRCLRTPLASSLG